MGENDKKEEKDNTTETPTIETVKTNLWGTLTRIFKDMITLDVVTLSGNIELTLTDVKDLETLFAKIEPLQANLDVVAVSHHDVDYDAVQFIRSGQESSELTTLHNETVKTAMEMRQKVVEMAFNGIKNFLQP